MESFTPKKVDESWKASVNKEKEAPTESPAPAVPENDFLSFISTLAVQAMASLGEMPLQEGEEPRVDLVQAKYLIDVLQMLSDKTQKNLSKQESDSLNTLLYELRVKFVAKKQASGGLS